jgi:deoxyribodipyrimidine photo-lyase
MIAANPQWPIAYKDILLQVKNLDVKKYAASRNYENGAVSRLSPYISRGVISLPLIKEIVLEKYSVTDAYKFIYELAWREYFQRVWQQQGVQIFDDVKHPQQNVCHKKVPKAIVKANTGIEAIDRSIQNMYATGYMHNHLRMYVASITCNIAQAHWKEPARWMYYYLLDGDIASNTLSWQWVAGTFSTKKYYCNQENINRYTFSRQRNTFLDRTYEALAECDVPAELKPVADLELKIFLLENSALTIDTRKPTLLYHHYSIDPTWRTYMDANRILLLDAEHFQLFPVCEKVMDFFVALASENIQGIQIFSGSFWELKLKTGDSKIFFKKHPAFLHWQGTADEADYLFPYVKKVSGSFSHYWKQCERFL